MQKGLNKYRKITAGIILTYIVLMVCSDYLIIKQQKQEQDKIYNIEINRVARYIEKTGEVPSLSEYPHIKRIKILPGEYGLDKLKKNTMIENSNYYLLLFEKKNEICYAKIYYTTRESAVKSSAFISVVIQQLMGAVIIGFVLLFVEREILLPFCKIENMPYKLSKGILTKDITECKYRFLGQFIWGLNMLREKLEQQRNNELKFAKENKTLILSISHDIKTPLSTIKMGTRALQVGLYETKEEQQQVLANIQKSAEDIEDMVKRIMETARGDFIDIQVEMEHVYLKEILSELRSYFAERMEWNHTEFIIEPYEDCLLCGDKNRIIEVLQNLIDNALKYGDGSKIWIANSIEEGYHRITVGNTGSSLPREETVHIFESFYRGSNVGDKQGNGLGLYISREIMHKMNGQIYAEQKNNELRIHILLMKM